MGQLNASPHRRRMTPPLMQRYTCTWYFNMRCSTPSHTHTRCTSITWYRLYCVHVYMTWRCVHVYSSTMVDLHIAIHTYITCTYICSVPVKYWHNYSYTVHDSKQPVLCTRYRTCMVYTCTYTYTLRGATRTGHWLDALVSKCACAVHVDVLASDRQPHGQPPDASQVLLPPCPLPLASLSLSLPPPPPPYLVPSLGPFTRALHLVPHAGAHKIKNTTSLHNTHAGTSTRHQHSTEKWLRRTRQCTGETWA